MASVGQGGYLSPMAAFAAAQMQHMATINGLPGAPLTPTSGKVTPPPHELYSASLHLYNVLFLLQGAAPLQASAPPQ